MVIVSLGSVVLAFALYATLKPVNSLLAQLAMIFSLADAFLALVVRMSSFVTAHLYTSPQTAGASALSAQVLVDLMRRVSGATENIGGICFGAGSLLFFCLFFKSRYIPRTLSLLGVFAAAIWTSLYFANLIFPERHSFIPGHWLPADGARRRPDRVLPPAVRDKDEVRQQDRVGGANPSLDDEGHWEGANCRT